jgi:hypothetical protein
MLALVPPACRAGMGREVNAFTPLGESLVISRLQKQTYACRGGVGAETRSPRTPLGPHLGPRRGRARLS